MSGRGMGRGSGKGGGMGPVGNCVCMKCGYSVPKRNGVPCMETKCPKCGTVLLRENGSHFESALRNKKR